MAVRLGGRYGCGCDRAAGPAPVLDDYLLAEGSGKFVAEEACEDVGRAPGWERHHKANSARRIDLSGLPGSGNEGERRRQNGAPKAGHGPAPAAQKRGPKRG